MVIVLFLKLKLLLFDNIELFSQWLNTILQLVDFPMRQNELHRLFVFGITLDRAFSQTLKRITRFQLVFELLPSTHATRPGV